jgi:tartrate dehydrogenase/decarboxylase/D-malate dehydrogenase
VIEVIQVFYERLSRLGGGTPVREIRLAVIPGDGIGKEVVPAGQKVLDAAAALHGGFRFTYDIFPWGCEYYLTTGRMMPEDALTILRSYDAIYLGAVGFPGVPDHVSLWGLLLPIRRFFQQYINLRPVRLLPGIRTPLAGRVPADIDFLVVRENNEGEYSNMGGRMFDGTPEEVVIQNTLFTRRGVERVIRYAFDLAAKTGRKLVTSATKSNGINYTMPFWDEVFVKVAGEYPQIKTDRFHIDALAARFVTHPQHFGVVVGSNLFGDILTDLGAAIAGSIGIAPSANLNPEGTYPSMFEPVHGSAPDIAGKGIANPLGQIWCGAMMLEHFGFQETADLVLQAVINTLREGICTADLGGKANTLEMTAVICDHLRKLVQGA